MNRITGLPQQPTPLSKAKRSKKSVSKTEGESRSTQVATVNTKPIRMASEERINQSRLQYDLPEGSARRAMQEYLKVASAARREELAQLVGVDLYI